MVQGRQLEKRGLLSALMMQCNLNFALLALWYLLVPLGEEMSA